MSRPPRNWAGRKATLASRLAKACELLRGAIEAAWHCAVGGGTVDGSDGESVGGAGRGAC